MGCNILNKKFVLVAIFIIVGLILGIRLRYESANLSHRNTESNKSEPLVQTELNKRELLIQKTMENLMLIMNENMGNIFADYIVDNGSIVIHLNVSVLEQEKTDDIITYISKSLEDFTKEDIIIKSNNMEIIYPLNIIILTK